MAQVGSGQPYAYFPNYIWEIPNMNGRYFLIPF